MPAVRPRGAISGRDWRRDRWVTTGWNGGHTRRWGDALVNKRPAADPSSPDSCRSSQPRRRSGHSHTLTAHLPIHCKSCYQPTQREGTLLPPSTPCQACGPALCPGLAATAVNATAHWLRGRAWFAAKPKKDPYRPSQSPIEAKPCSPGCPGVRTRHSHQASRRSVSC